MIVVPHSVRRAQFDSRALLVAAVMATGIILGPTSWCCAQQGDLDHGALYRWKEVRAKFQKAGRLIGEEQFEEAREILAAVKENSPRGYAMPAEMRLLRLRSAVSGNPFDNPFGGEIRPLRFADLCFELEAYEAAEHWLEKASRVIDDQPATQFEIIDHPVFGKARFQKMRLGTYETAQTREAIARMERRIEERRQATRQFKEKPGDLDSICSAARDAYYYGKSDRPYFRTLAMLEAALPMATTNKERQRLYEHIGKCLYYLGDKEGQTAWEDKLLRETQDDIEIAAKVAMDRAKRAYHAKEYDDALRHYRGVCSRLSKSSRFNEARCNIGVILRKQKKYDQAVAAYHKLLDSEVDDKEANYYRLASIRAYRRYAAMGISTCYLSQRQYAKSLEYAYVAREEARRTPTHPLGGFGSSHPLLEYAGATIPYRIETCLLHLRRHTEAVEMTLRDMQKRDLSRRRAVRLLSLYEAAGQIADLIAMTDELNAPKLARYREDGYLEKWSPERVRRSLPAATLSELLHIHDLGKRGDYAALITICESSTSATDDFSLRWDSWRQAAAGDALALGGDEAANAILVHIENLEDGMGPAAWLVYALGKSSSPRTLPWLESFAWDRVNWFAASCVVHAISFKGEPGLEIIRRMARDGEGNLKIAAERLLESLVEAPTKTPKWRDPEPGSLPKRLPPKTSSSPL